MSAPRIPYLGAVYFLAIAALLAFTGIATSDGHTHPYIDWQGLVASVVATIAGLALSRTSHAVAQVLAVLAFGYFTQRTVTLCLYPTSIEYFGSVDFTPAIFRDASFYYAGSIVFATFGVRLANSKPSMRSRPAIVEQIAKQEAFGRNFRNAVCALVITSCVLKAISVFFFKIGIAHQEMSRAEAVAFRAAGLFLSAKVIVIFWFVDELNHNLRKSIASLAVVALLFDMLFVQPGKGALLVLGTGVLTAYLVRDRLVPRSVVAMGITAVLATVLLISPLATWLRVIQLAVADSGAGLVNAVKQPVSSSGTQPLEVMARLGGLDWLTALVAADRSSFVESASLTTDLRHAVNSVIPGELWPDPEGFVHIGKLMPMVLRGWTDQPIQIGGHAELMGGAGMAYVYFGTAGVIASAAWAYFCVAAYNNLRRPEYRVLLLNSAVVTVFIAGQINSAFSQVFGTLVTFASAHCLCALLTARAK